MWLQRWIGEVYSRLYQDFGRQTFELRSAMKLLGLDEPTANIAFSKLHSSGALIIFDRGRPRKYRLLDPRSLVLLLAQQPEKTAVHRLPQERYTQLAWDVFRAVRSNFSLTSFSIFGSVSRGEAKPSSDLDVLLVSDAFEGTLASRIDSLAYVGGEVSEELDFLRRQGVTPAVSLLPFRREELDARPVILLDLSVNATILYDPDDVLGGVLRGIRARLEVAGSKRVATAGGGWYWDLKPDFRPGQEVVV